ncbi:hypothetical protein MNBD_GAMMA16-1579 [hydrothermal vent metagenome]|uniref:Energy-coupling factor transporter transmembrane protein EcfT n=1 Tax=hydrothermal vent metagenome TaxID=652676 RepID=A0A3B0YVB0_9ZZZZ
MPISGIIIHPVIRLTTLIVFAISVSLGQVGDVAAAVLILFCLYLILGFSYLSGVSKLLRRMKWFFISITVLYLWFTPGEAIFSTGPAWSTWWPTIEGLQQALHRVTALIIIIAAVSLLLKTTSRTQLLTAIYSLAYPFQYLGLSRERLAIRMTLVLGLVDESSLLMKDVRERVGNQTKSKVTYIGRLAGELFWEAIQRAEAMPSVQLEITIDNRPPLYQWLLPFLLLVLL